MKTRFIVILILSCLVLAAAEAAPPTVITYPAPQAEPASGDYTVEVEGKPVFVYAANVLSAGPASFAYFDFSGTVNVKVTVKRETKNAVIRPASYGITNTVENNIVRFSLSRPGNLSIEPNGQNGRPLLLFANPVETDPPKPGDPNVIYFGPGLHELGGCTRIPSNTTVYIAGGAVIRGKLLADEPCLGTDILGGKHYAPLFFAEDAQNVTIRGRGIIIGSAIPWPAKSPIQFSKCVNFRVEGIIVVDSPVWNMPCFECRKGLYKNIKQISHRENSDGINICNSQDIAVEDCFLRTNDDIICVKTPTPPPAQEGRNISVSNCVIWNDRAMSLGITYETRASVSNVLFRNCDIIHDWGIASLAVHVCDSGTMSGIRFEDIRVEDTRRLVRMWIGSDMWGKDRERGHIRGVTFKNVSVTGGTPGSEITGADPGHLAEDITFDHLRVNGKLIRNAVEGNISLRNTAGVRFITADAPPKQAPRITSARAVTDSRVDLAWTAVSDPGDAVLSYSVYRDNVKIGESAATSFSDNGVREKTAYAYCVSAANGFPQEGPKSETVRVVTPSDTTPPAISSVWSLPGKAPLVGVAFDEPLEQSSAEKPANYAIDNAVSVKGATLDPDRRSVRLAVDKLDNDLKYTLTVNNVRDAAARPNIIAPNSRKTFSSVSGLVAHWTLSDGSGTRVSDCSGEKNDGALRGLPAWVSGREGRGLKLEPDNYVEIPNSASLEKVQEGDYTLCAWFTPLSVPAGTGEANNAAYGILMKAGYHLGLTYSHDKKFAMMHWLQGDQGAGASSAASFDSGRPYHVAGVVDRAAGIVRIYVNGRLEGEGRFSANATPRPYGTTQWRLGIANPDAPTYRWPAHGIIGGAQIFNVALSPDQIRAVAESAVTR